MNLLNFLFPRRCLSCGTIGKYFCSRCVGKIRTIEQRETICPVCERPAISGATHPFCKTRYTIDGLTGFFHYDGIIRKAIKSLKYRSVSDLAKEFVGLIPDTVLSHIVLVCHSRENGNPVFIPVPLHSSRYKDRGFNQAEVLAQFIARRLSLRVATDILKRVKHTTPQVEMKDRNKRLKNMEKVFSVLHSPFPFPYSVILFDDVFTTGATMRAAANILKREGVKFVWGITMAR